MALSIADKYIRNFILADLHKHGELQWKVVDGGVTVADNPKWNTFWIRLEKIIDEFKRASPRDRRKRLTEAMKQSRKARREMMKFAKEMSAEPCS